MTTRPTVMDKDHLAAFVDGELSPEESARVAMHLADHPQDQLYVDDLMAANAALAQAFGDPLDEPVPQGLRDLILRVPAAQAQAQVIPLRRASSRPGRARWGGLAVGAALAAGLALAVFRPVAAPQGLVPGPLAAGSPLHAALTSLPAGEARSLGAGVEVTVLGTVPVPKGYCREVEVIRAEAGQLEAALACTDGAGWRIEVVIAEALGQAAEAEGFATASGDEAPGFAPFLDRIGAGAFLGPDEEAEVMARGWTP